MIVNRSAPRAIVAPVLVYEDVAKAIDWLCDTFGFRERLRGAGPGGSVTMRSSTLPRGPSLEVRGDTKQKEAYLPSAHKFDCAF